MDKKDISKMAQEIEKMLKISGAGYEDILKIISEVNKQAYSEQVRKRNKKLGGER